MVRISTRFHYIGEASGAEGIPNWPHSEKYFDYPRAIHQLTSIERVPR